MLRPGDMMAQACRWLKEQTQPAASQVKS